MFGNAFCKCEICGEQIPKSCIVFDAWEDSLSICEDCRKACKDAEEQREYLNKLK